MLDVPDPAAREPSYGSRAFEHRGDRTRQKLYDEAKRRKIPGG
jgi:hypothetical protein